MLWRWFGCLMLVAGLGLGSRLVHAQDKDTEWKAFDKSVNKVYYQKQQTETNQTMKVLQMDVKQVQSQIFYIKWTPGDKDDKGNWTVTQNIIGVTMDIDIGGTKIAYDSTDPNQPPNPLSDFFKELMKIDLKFNIDPKTFKVNSIDGRKEAIKKLAGQQPNMEALLNNILSEDSLKTMAEQSWGAFPTDKDKEDKEWKDSKKWKRDSSMDMGPIGIYKFANTYTWGKDDKINMDTTLTYEVQTDAKKKEGLPFVITKGSLKSQKSTGYLKFNKKEGRFDESQLDMEVKGELEVNIGGQNTTVELNQTQKASVITTNDDPVEKIRAEKKKKS